MIDLHIATDRFANTKSLSAGSPTLLVSGSYIATVRASARTVFVLVFLHCLYFVSTLKQMECLQVRILTPFGFTAHVLSRHMIVQ